MKIPGALPYVAPEVLRYGKDKLSIASDIWAVGCIGYELFTGRPLFDSEAMIERFVLTGEVELQMDLLQSYPTILEVLQNCLHPDDKKRWSIWILMDHLNREDAIE
jgi:serine/threonine protein kinase